MKYHDFWKLNEYSWKLKYASREAAMDELTLVIIEANISGRIAQSCDG